MKTAKIVHDNLNAGGGSERLAIITLGLLVEMGFRVDVASFKRPEIEQIKEKFGSMMTSSIKINKFIPLDVFSAFCVPPPTPQSTTTPPKSEKNDRSIEKRGNSLQESNDDSAYDLIINTHGDLLPYYSNESSEPKHVITYCHYPLLPKLIENNEYTQFLQTLIENDDKNYSGILSEGNQTKHQILSNALKIYDQMMKNTIILTNSFFSKKAIENLYGAAVNPVVIYPPVDVEKLRQTAGNSVTNRENIILVISRFSPSKKLENAIEIGNVLAKKRERMRDSQAVKMILVGNVVPDDQPYLQKLKEMVQRYELQDRISFEVGVSLDRLMDLMKRSKIYLHPLAGEPFGISIIEAMSAGLIPVVPDTGGFTEVVPKKYQFHDHQHAADIIQRILVSFFNSSAFDSNNNKIDDVLEKEIRVSEAVSKFTTDNYKDNFRKVIQSALSPS